MSEESPPPSSDDLDARLRQAKARRGAGQQSAGRASGGTGLGFALRIASELVVGIAVGVGIGLVLDSWLETGPWLLILFFMLGAAAGMLNVYRAAMGYGHAVGYKKGHEERKAPDTEKHEGSAEPDPGGSG